MKKLVRILAVMFICATVFASVCQAMVPYATYTYSIDGEVLESPDAYVPDSVIDSEYIGLEEDKYLAEVTDLTVDSDNNVYITETSLNRVIILDRYYKLKFQIDEFVNEHGIPDGFNGPQGVFISEDYIYVWRHR